MKKGQFSESVIFQVLKEAEAGVPVPELCRKHGMSSASFYKWRAKYGGMDDSHMKRLKELEAENARLKKMYAEEKLKAEIVAEALEKSGEAISTQGDGTTRGGRARHQHPTCLSSIRYLRDLLSLPGQAQRRQRIDRGLAATADDDEPSLGLRVVLFVSSQRPGLSV